MIEARQGKEIVVRVKNRIGLLFELSRLISEKGVGILAVTSDVSGKDCVVRLVTDDNLRAAEALTEYNYLVHEENVILIQLPHKPGMLKRITEALALQEIDIRHLYATALPGQDKCFLVLRTSNDEYALPRLNRA